MEYINLKDTDLSVSKVCLGGGNFGEKIDEEMAFSLLDAFVEGGGNFIDTANVYCRWVPGLANVSEQIIGRWLKRRGTGRGVVIATKGAHYDVLSKDQKPRVDEASIRTDLAQSMEALGLDTIDFYWLHRDDPTRPVEEIIDILEKLRSEGKIRYYGLSNYETKRLAAARSYLQSKGLGGPYAVSNQWSLASVNPGKNTNQDPTLVLFSDEEYRWHVETKVPVIPFSSTASGFFQKLKNAGVRVKNGMVSYGDPRRALPAPLLDAYLNEENLLRYEQLLEEEAGTGRSIQTLSLIHLAKQPFQVIPITSARNLTQLREVLEAL